MAQPARTTQLWEEVREQRSLEAAQVNEQPSLTLQGPAREADINQIAKAYGLTGKQMPVPEEALDPRYYGDLSDIPDLQTALNRIREAEEHFMNLPPDLRHRFHDSPGVLWDFVNNPENAEEAVRLGLLRRYDAPQSTNATPPVTGGPPQTPSPQTGS